MMNIRCVTLNLAGLQHRWFKERCEAVVRGLRQLEPDVVCFQETTVRMVSPHYDQAEDIGRALGLDNVAFAPYGNPVEATAREHGGIAIVSRWPFRLVRNLRLPSPVRKEPDARTALMVTIKSPSGDLTVVNLHFSWRPEEADVRVAQMEHVIDDVVNHHWEQRGRRTIVAGDINAVPDEAAVLLTREYFTDAFAAVRPDEPGYTWAHSNVYTQAFGNSPERRLDYIFVPREVKVLDAGLALTRADPVFPSDHYAVFADLSWR